MPKLDYEKILWLCLLVGLLDITAACLQFYFKTGKVPVPVLKFIANGLFGKRALSGGSEMILAGLIIHFLIAMTFTFVFFILISKVSLLRKNRLLTGLLYGTFVWFVMNILVWPITKLPHRNPNLENDLAAIVILIVCIGLPLAFLAIPKHKTLSVSR